MTTTTLQQIIGGSSITEDSSFKELFNLLWKLKLYESGGESFITIPQWEIPFLLYGLAFIFLVPALLFLPKIFRKTSAFEKIKFRQKDIHKSLLESLYIEITLPTNSQATAFQIQQKILKTFHSIYTDPVAHLKALSPL